MQNFNEQIVLRDYLRIFYRHKIFFIIIPISLMLPLYLGFKLATPAYVAEVKMFVKAQKKTEAEYYRATSGSQSVTSEHIELVKSNIVLKRVVEALKLYERPIDYEKKFASPLKAALIDRRLKKSMSRIKKMSPERKNISPQQTEDESVDGAIGNLSSSISVVPVKDSSLFTISVTDFNPAMAIIIANSVSRSYVMFDLEQQIEELKLKYGEKHSTVIQLENYVQDFQKTLDGNPIPDIEAIGPASVKIIAQAAGASPAGGVSKNVLLVAIFVVGIFSAGMFSFLVEYFDNTLRTPKDIVRNLNLPFLGSMPKRKKGNMLVMAEPNTANKSNLKCVDAFQRLGDKICLLSKNQNIRSILATAIDENSGDVSAVIANIGIYLSRDAGKKVLLIDANLKNPTLCNVLNLPLPETSGLVELFKGEKTFKEAVVSVGENLDILTAKPAQFRPIKLLDSAFMASLIEESKCQYDFVFVGCGVNLRLESDPVILSAYIDAVMFIIDEGKDRTPDVQIAIESLKQNHGGNGNFIFTVLNNRKKDMPKILYKIS